MPGDCCSPLGELVEIAFNQLILANALVDFQSSDGFSAPIGLQDTPPVQKADAAQGRIYRRGLGRVVFVSMFCK